MNHYKSKISERTLSNQLNLSRTTLRKALSFDESVKLSTLKKIANYFDRTIKVITYPKSHTPNCTTVSTSFRIAKDGFGSWKIHLMEMVDEFRKTKDMRIFLLPPDSCCPEKINALIAATVIELCDEQGFQTPEWALSIKPLEEPWFVSEMNSLKASALLESPFSFRCKNIFVHDNFLLRA
ncbi:MAG: hypothetical protein KDD58_11245 [Bdellovibrionales bacterium]|nr:hypothetical protein [Bdellovibrionales bacterium]